ncbi:MAG: KpsF/GutQ family sugar-phosphate isomerase [Sphingobacteriales bacterium]|nr:KpsF/GutQ family sugar-phosphate isomerase [Sphingobacteriales bacterium]
MILIDEIINTIKIEAEELIRFINYFDKETFIKALDILNETEGKIIITGIGKSGHIGKKMVATFSSTGKPSFFLHPSEALHGDLGIVSKSDTLIAISRSGESEEINLILPYFKKNGNNIISITSNPQSTLATNSNLNILYSITREACPNNLAPTTSTTLTLAIGDALAVGLMIMKDFKSDDFARFHPGGRLGRRLTLFVNDILIPKENLAILNSTNCSMEEILIALSSNGLGIVFFTDDFECFQGIITDGDIRRLLKDHKNMFFELNVEDFINRNPIKINAELKATEALKLMEERQKPLNVLPVMDDFGKIKGIIRLHELYKLLN